jgi:beta-glucosidase
MDASKRVTDRVAALLGQMSLDEKIGQMTQIEKNAVDPANAAAFNMGSILSGGGGFPDPNTPKAWYDMVNGYQQAALGTRLGIPIIYGVDAVHGHNNVAGATIFPHNVGMGATNDPALVQQACAATALEMNATGVRWDFGPVVAVPQDIRWGRTYEGYGESTDRVASLGAACVKGLQGPGLGADDASAATAKHFIGDGGTAFGTSTATGPNGPYLLDQGADQMDEPTLLKLFLPPYKAAVESGARIVMASYSSTSAGKVHGDRHLLTEVLKGQLAFSGFVVSDWGGVDQLTPGDYSASLALAINAGIDMVMVPTDYVRFITTLKSRVQLGRINEDRIDDAVSRILGVKFEMGLFEKPMPAAGRESQVGSDANRAIARTAVAESAVLLKTSPNILPLAASGRRVLLAGPGADDIGIQSGGWTITWQGSKGDITPGTTLKSALAATLGDNLTYERNAAFTAGTKAEVGIVVVAERPYAEGVGDSSTLSLPSEDVALVRKVRPLVDKLVVVVMSGRPMVLGDLASADQIVAAWLPGTEATGLADVLLGDKPFVGTTPYSWPKTPADAPRVGKAACDGAVYPVGYGLDGTGRLLGPAACLAAPKPQDESRASAFASRGLSLPESGSPHLLDLVVARVRLGGLPAERVGPAPLYLVVARVRLGGLPGHGARQLSLVERMVVGLLVRGICGRNARRQDPGPNQHQFRNPGDP